MVQLKIYDFGKVAKNVKMAKIFWQQIAKNFGNKKIFGNELNLYFMWVYKGNCQIAKNFYKNYLK